MLCKNIFFSYSKCVVYCAPFPAIYFAILSCFRNRKWKDSHCWTVEWCCGLGLTARFRRRTVGLKIDLSDFLFDQYAPHSILLFTPLVRVVTTLDRWPLKTALDYVNMAGWQLPLVTHAHFQLYVPFQKYVLYPPITFCN